MQTQIDDEHVLCAYCNEHAPLAYRLLKSLAIPATVNELASIFELPRRRVHATLVNLRKAGKAKVITHKREERKGGPSAIWGLPGIKHIGWIKVEQK